MDIKVFKGKHISRCVDWENLIYVRWYIASKTMQESEEGD